MSAIPCFPAEYGRETELATLWKMEMQHYGKITCNFVEKVLAKNNRTVVEQAVQDGGGNDGVSKDLAPLAESPEIITF